MVNLARQRVGGYLTALLPVIWQRRADHVGHFGLAAAVCRDDEGELGNVGELIRLADRHHIVEKGRVVWAGTSTELARDRDLQHRYLGV